MNYMKKISDILEMTFGVDKSLITEENRHKSLFGTPFCMEGLQVVYFLMIVSTEYKKKITLDAIEKYGLDSIDNVIKWLANTDTNL